MRSRRRTGGRAAALCAALIPVLAGATDLEVTSSWDSFLVWSASSGLAPTLASPGFTVVDSDGDGRDDIIYGVTEPLSAFRRISYSPASGRYFMDRSVPNPYPLADQLNPELRIVTSLTPGGPLKAITWQMHSVAIYDVQSGRLERLSDPSGYEWPIPVCAIDVNGDGTKEIIVRDALTIRVMNSTLTRELGSAQSVQGFRARSADAVCANLDADAAIEIAIEDGNIFELEGFALRTQGTVDSIGDATPSYAGSADIDGDGNQELFVVYGEVGEVRVHDFESGHIAWSINESAIDSRVLAARVVDIDRDGIKDLLIVTEGHPASPGLIIGYDGADGHELVRIQHPDISVFAVNAGDFDGDGTTEIAAVLIRPFTGPNRLYLYDAMSGALKWRSEHEEGPVTAAAMHDLDQDGQPEIVVAARGVVGVGDIRLQAFDANTFQRRWATNHQILPLPGAGAIASLAMGDVDGDGANEIVVGLQKDGSAQVAVLNGTTRSFVRMFSLTEFEKVEALALYDFDGDGDQEIVAAASAPYPSIYGGEAFILDGVTGQTLARGGLGTFHARHLTAIRVGDVSADGHPDVVVSGVSAEGFGGSWFVMDGVSHAVSGQTDGPGYHGMALIDVNGDGTLEVALGTTGGNIEVRRGSDLALLRILSPCTTPVWAITANNLAGASPGQAYFTCDDRVGGADLRAGGAAQGITGMVGFRVGNGNVLLATGTNAAPRITTSTVLGLRHLTAAPNSARPYIVPGNHQNGPSVFAAPRTGTFNGQITFGNFSGRATQMQLVEGPRYGQFALLPGGAFTYRTTEVHGVDLFTVRAIDGVTESAPMTFAILNSNSSPLVPFSAEFTATQGVALLVASGATDLDGDNMQFTVVTPPTKGTLTFRADGMFTYTPNATATGDDNFEYYASDVVRRSGNNGAVVIHIQVATPAPPPPPPPPAPTPPADPPASGGGGGGAFDLATVLALLCAYACMRRPKRPRPADFP